MALAPGARLGPYEIVAALGAGGMGEVYRARDTRLDRTVAVKILPAHLSTDSARKLRFEREARTVSGLNHPNICSLFDVGSQDGVDFLVMECIEGETLALRLAKGALPADQVLRIGTEIADALDKAHRSGVVHRDLKPGNIMLTKTGAKLLDFGLAKPAVSPVSRSASSVTVDSPASPVTEQGTIVGTFQYMSPEQVEGKELDGRSDLFSLGAVLYEMLTGQRAFQGKSQLSVASAILEQEPAPITSVKPLTPRSLDHIVRRCLAKDPDDRWQSARDLALELKSISQIDPASSSAALPVSRRMPRRELLAWAVAAAAVLAASALLFLRRSPDRPTLPTYASIAAPADAAFRIEGDQGAPPALAPDGSAIVFGAGDELWYRSLRGGLERALSGARGASDPFWSPDSSSLGFFADGKLKTIDISSGVVRTLCDAPNARGGSWGAGGVILLAPTVRDGIYQVPVRGGAPTLVTHLDPNLHTTHRWPFFLPDGRHFLYLATNHGLPQGERNGIYVASLDGKDSRLLVPSLAGATYSGGNLLYVNQSTLLAQPLDLKKLALVGVPAPLAEGIVVDLGVWHAAFTASQNGELVYQTGAASAKSALEWVDRQGKHLSFVGEKGDFFGLRLSHDGRRILFNAGDPAADTWMYDASNQTKTRLTFEGASISEGAWSPDDSRFAVSLGLPGNAFNLVVKPSTGSGEATVIEKAADTDSPLDWSPDGRYLLTERFLHGRTEIWLHPLFPGEAARPLLTSAATQGLQSSGQFSPDGKFVAFTLAGLSGQLDVFIVPFPSGSGMWQVSTNGGRWPRWRRDGKELYFVSTRNVVTAVEIHEKGDGFEVGPSVALFPFRPSLRTYRQGMMDYDVSADGKRFLINTVADQNVRPLTFVLNWPAALLQK